MNPLQAVLGVAIQIALVLCLLIWMTVLVQRIKRKRQILKHLERARDLAWDANDYASQGMTKNSEACLRSSEEETAKANFLRALQGNPVLGLRTRLWLWWLSYRIKLVQRDIETSRIWIWTGHTSISFERIWRFYWRRLRTVGCLRFGPLAVTVELNR